VVAGAAAVLSSKIRWFAQVLTILLAGCGDAPREEAGAAPAAGGGKADRAGQQEVVGGRPEAGYPAVGYLLIGKNGGAPRGPYCGATLIAPRVAVTAAHCTVDDLDESFAVALLVDGRHVAFPAERVIVHPRYDRWQSARYRHDIAALILAEAPPVAPATIAEASSAQAARYVGYGRVTPGDDDVTDGYTGERKSASQRVARTDTWNVWTRGGDGGLCWGDSGGPLMASEGAALGLLADFDGVFSCFSGNAMIFTSLWAERDFVTQAIGCAGDAACQPSCDFLCTTYGYAAGECRGGWTCNGTCITYTGAC
jgi:hypothetical protein